MLRNSVITCTSGDPSSLTDFKLSDSDDITNLRNVPTQHGWYPDDGHGKIYVTFPEPRVVREIWLYDDTNINNNVLETKVILSNGREYDVNDIDAGVVPKRILTECHDCIEGFTVEVGKGIGSCGFAEIEAFSESPKLPFRIIKLMDEDGDFIYTYHTGISGNVFCSLWNSPGTCVDDCRLVLAEGTAKIDKRNAGWRV